MKLGFEVAFNPPVDGNCFYFSAANALGIETHNLKNVIFKYVCVRRLFDYLKSHRFDVSVFIAYKFIVSSTSASTSDFTRAFSQFSKFTVITNAY